MPKVIVLPHPTLSPQGKIIEQVPEGSILCEVLLENGIAIEHACELSCACTTCHVHLKKGFDSVEEPNELEEDLLDLAWDLDSDSRLSCQVKIGQEDLVVSIPKYTINHAKENS